MPIKYYQKSMNTIIISLFLLSSPMCAQFKPSKVPSGFSGPQIEPPKGYNLDMGAEKAADSFNTDEPGSIRLGMIKIPEGSIYKLRLPEGIEISILYHKNGASVKDKTSKIPTLKNLMTNKILEFSPTNDLFPSAKLKLEVTPQTKTITFETMDKHTGGYTSILNIPKLIQLLEKDLKAHVTPYWPNQYIFVNGHPITITLNISIEVGFLHIDSIKIGYFLTTSRSIAGRKYMYNKLVTKTFSNKQLSDQEVLIEYIEYPTSTTS